MAQWNEIETLTAPRGTDLYRRICELAGTPIPGPEEGRPGPGEVVVKQGYATSYSFASRLRAALGDEDAIVMKFERAERGKLISTTYVAFDERTPAKCAYQRITY